MIILKLLWQILCIAFGFFGLIIVLNHHLGAQIYYDIGYSPVFPVALLLIYGTVTEYFKDRRRDK